MVKSTALSRNKLDKTHQQQMRRLFVASSCKANVYLSKTVHNNYNNDGYKSLKTYLLNTTDINKIYYNIN